MRDRHTEQEARSTAVTRFLKLFGRRLSEKRSRHNDRRAHSGWGKHLRGTGWRGVRDAKP